MKNNVDYTNIELPNYTNDKYIDVIRQHTPDQLSYYNGDIEIYVKDEFDNCFYIPLLALPTYLYSETKLSIFGAYASETKFFSIKGMSVKPSKLYPIFKNIRASKESAFVTTRGGLYVGDLTLKDAVLVDDGKDIYFTTLHWIKDGLDAVEELGYGIRCDCDYFIYVKDIDKRLGLLSL